jgi:hypothetical protein
VALALCCAGATGPAIALAAPADVPGGVPPTLVRDAGGGTTVRAVRLTSPLTLDGRLDEEVYRTVPPAGDFIQQIPRAGVPATEATEAWVFFDDRNVYVSARCLDSHPELEIVTEVRRDGSTMSQNDNFTLVLDTFHDKRSGYYFQTNPLSALREQTMVNSVMNESWNTVWDVRTARGPEGYTVEIVIPFKSLRYRGAGPQTWGINFRRIVRWKNETSNLTRIPVEYGTAGVTQLAVAGNLVGIEAPPLSKNFEIKPYVVSQSTTDLAARAPFTNAFKASTGIDMKYGLTASLTADVTVNTDFAQIEEDLQQVNLTRFNLQFPEKRTFFLEGQGIFVFGEQGGDVPTLFFSRQIGLGSGQPVPVIAGARVTGKAGPYDIGLVNIQTGDKASAGAVSTNFSTLRVKRDILRRSNVGVLATARRPGGGGRTNAVIGFDSQLAFFRNIESTFYWAKTSSAHLLGEDVSYRGRFAYTGDRYGIGVDHVMVGDHFNPEVGFVRRDDYRRSLVEGRFSPRLKKHPVIRRLNWEASLDYVTDAKATRLMDRVVNGSFGIEFHKGDSASLRASDTREFLPARFTIAPGVVVPSGYYDQQNTSLSFTLGQQRKVSGTLSTSRGAFYGGTRTTAGYTGRVVVSPHLVLEPGVTLNWVDLPVGTFNARIITNRLIVTPKPRMGFSSLVQWNALARTLTASARMSWEYIPGSELFVVYSDGRTTTGAGYPDLVNRTIAVKATRLVRF